MRGFPTIALSAGLLLLLNVPLRAGEFTIIPDVVYGHKAGMALTYDVIRPEKQNGAGVLFIVSGGWVSTWIPPESIIRKNTKTPNVHEALVDKGYTLFLVRHGSSPYFKVPDAVSDVRRAVRFIRAHQSDYGIDADRLGVYGFSAGGHLTLMLGTTSDEGNPNAKDPVDRVSNRVAAIVAVVAPTKLADLFPLKQRFVALDFPQEQEVSVSPLEHASKDDAAALLIYGEKDDLVPLSHGERMAKAFEKEGAPHELLIISGAGHAFKGIEQVQMQEALLNWFDQHLLKK